MYVLQNCLSERESRASRDYCHWSEKSRGEGSFLEIRKRKAGVGKLVWGHVFLESVWGACSHVNELITYCRPVRGLLQFCTWTTIHEGQRTVSGSVLRCLPYFV